ncbi:MAG TPA: GGDEF domain-containing protein, partial [Tepidisphaeraceae bacterium]|nr:GGDEF domain-containing protein [Tepidisphaeraceae bacterium]
RADEALATLAAGGQQPPTAPAAEQDTGPKPAPATVPAADPASGLASRAVFDAFLAEQFADARASNRPLAVLLVHADELVSGTHGPAAPDAVLRAIGALLKSAARAQDLTARYANEELCLALPGVTRKAAAAIAETVRQAVAARPVHVGATRLPITASVGVAAVEPGDPFREPAHLLKAAELAVYAAKNGGRNCVKVFALPRPNAKPAAA